MRGLGDGDGRNDRGYRGSGHALARPRSSNHDDGTPLIRDPRLARRVWSRLEPIHAVTYFSPEAITALSEAGYKGFWMGYFAGRAAPLGPVGPAVVFATFYNFSMAHVTRAIPDAWGFAPPDAAFGSAPRRISVGTAEGL